MQGSLSFWGNATPQKLWHTRFTWDPSSSQSPCQSGLLAKTSR
jgi:hypothetical protein